MRVGIVVVTYNGLGFTRECLRSLANVTYRNRMVVVVDNASTDGTEQAIRAEFPWATLLVQTENLGFTGGNNAGIRWCLDHDCDAVLILNNDTRVDPGFLQPMTEHVDQGCIVGPEIRSLENPARVNEEVTFFDWQRGVALPPSLAPASNGGRTPSRITSGCCFLVPRAVFERVGLLDDDFFIYFEEVDFQVRAQLAGFRVVTEPRSVIYHREEVASGTRLSPFRLYYNNRNRLHLMRKHHHFSAAFLAYFLAARLAHTARFIVRGERDLLVSMWGGVRDFFAGRSGRADRAW